VSECDRETSINEIIARQWAEAPQEKKRTLTGDEGNYFIVFSF
jgi:hypothetical protein